MKAHCDPLKWVEVDHLPPMLKRELIQKLEASIDRDDMAEVQAHWGQGPGVVDRAMELVHA